MGFWDIVLAVIVAKFICKALRLLVVMIANAL